MVDPTPAPIRVSHPVSSSPVRSHPIRGGRLRADLLLVGLLLAVGAFQLAVALGAPFGRLCWGGTHEGTLPPALRWSSAVAVVVYLLLAALAVAGPRTVGRRRLLRAASGLMAVGTLLNLASPSWAEKVLWAPVAAALAVLFWRRATRP